MKVYKVADIVEGDITPCGNGKFRPGDLAAILVNIQPVENANTDCVWKIDVEIRDGPSMRLVKLDIPHFISMSDSLESPLFIGDDRVLFFRNRLFMPERPPRNNAERDEMVLRVKKAVYDEDADLASLRSAVANMEAAIEFTRSGPKREPIPEDVKLVVWTRDGGSCVRCGSKQVLHFDHIIPVAKGGGHSEANIQILCQNCNLKKADKIAMNADLF